jgi:hypothetical protein
MILFCYYQSSTVLLKLKTDLWHFSDVSLCIFKVYSFSHSFSCWRHYFKSMDQFGDKLVIIMAPVKLKCELSIVLCIRRGCAWLVKSSVKWSCEQHLNMLRVLSARWPFRKESTRWDEAVCLVHLFRNKTGKVYILFKGILYDSA